MPTREDRDETTPEAEDAAAFPDGKDLITNAERNTNALETVRIKQVLTMNIDNTGSLNLDTTCDVNLLDFYCLAETTTDLGLGEPIVQIVAIVRFNDQVWIKQDDFDWIEVPPEQAATMTVDSVLTPPMTAASYEAEVVSEATIDGQPAYEIALTFDQESTLEILLQQAPDLAQLGANIEVLAASGMVWVGQDDALLYRRTLNLDYTVEDQTFYMTTQLSYSQQNQPLEIPNPANE